MINNVSRQMRITGLATGLDTDTLVKQMTAASRYRLASVGQQRDLLLWKQDAYRSLSKTLLDFQTKFLNVTSSTNALNGNFYRQLAVTSSNTSYVTAVADSTATLGDLVIDRIHSMASAAKLTKTDNSRTAPPVSTKSISDIDSFIGSLDGKEMYFKINGDAKRIVFKADDFAGVTDHQGLQSAMQSKIDTVVGSGKVQVGLNGDKLTLSGTSGNGLVFNRMFAGSDIADIGDVTFEAVANGTKVGGITDFTKLNGSSFSFDVATQSGETQGFTITVGNDLISATDSGSQAAEKLQDLINSQLGKEVVNVAFSGGELEFSGKSYGSGTYTTAVSAAGLYDALIDMGISNNASDKLNLDMSIKDLIDKGILQGTDIGADGEIGFTINNVAIAGLTEKSTLREMMSVVNSSNAGVKMSYDALRDSFTLEGKTTGAGMTMDVEDGVGKLLSALFGDDGTRIGSYAAGNDAVIEINGMTMSKSSNTFEINGIMLTVNSVPTDPSEKITLTTKADTDKAVASIKEFVQSYNDMLAGFNALLSEKTNKDYKPLTEEQRAVMSEDQIKQWEIMAKSGLLKNDPILSNLVSSMRNALVSSVTSLNDSAKSIGISLSQIGITTDSYETKGMLKIDENKLREALANNPDDVAAMFTQRPKNDYSSSMSSADRAVRFREAGLAVRLQDIIRDMIRTTDGKGQLLQKAGIKGDRTDTDNSISTSIKDLDKRINNLKTKLYKEEDRYYKKFTALETAMSAMNNQANWFATQFLNQQQQ